MHIFAQENLFFLRMKAIIDKAIPYVTGVLEPYMQVEYCDGVAISTEMVKDADLLIIRTRTRCNQQLLDGSKVKFIATATIGFDHIDLEYCRLHDITVTTAQGCNAAGVLQWVAAALAMLSKHNGWQPEDMTLGIVGVGHVGSLVEEYARKWGFRILRCDPPRKQREGGDFLPLHEVARKADIITFHTPLDSATHHLVNQELINIIPTHATIINASRGEVADTQALLHCSQTLAIDVWEDEPAINRKLLDKALITTPHIAGYSAQGKANASAAAIRAVAQHFSLPLQEWYPSQVTPIMRRDISWLEMCHTIGRYCNLTGESQMLKTHPEEFEQMRNNYSYREEYF